jgi:hypothetical protein
LLPSGEAMNLAKDRGHRSLIIQFAGDLLGKIGLGC